jgi:uncharacterized membrane protein YdjX (TVP38/TMEM64 family)
MNTSFISRKTHRVGLLVILVLIIAGVSALWRFTPLREHADQQAIARYLENIRYAWWTPVLLVVAYGLVHSVLFPNTILNAAVILTIGGFRGWLYAIAASLASATLFFFIGKRFGVVGIHAIEGRRLDRVRDILLKGRFGAVALVRLAPVAPYTVVNTFAGAIKLRYIDFIVGTFLAHLPGTVTLAVLETQLSEVVTRPGIGNIIAVIALAIIGGLVFMGVRRYAQRHLKHP